MPGSGHAVFRTDASIAIGGGHVRRCLVLADALAEIGWDISFVCSAEAENIVPALRRRSYSRIDPARFDSAPFSCALAVIDDYRLDAVFERGCRHWAKRLLVIDDLANRPHDCDVLLDQSPGRTPKDYAALLPGGCEMLLGPAYALLDARFRAAPPQREAGTVARLFVNFGTADAANATLVALDAVQRAKLGATVDVVLGGAAPHLGELRARVAAAKTPVSLHLDVDDMAALMRGADLAIGAGGVGALERCALGLPSLILTVADNQVANARALAAAGAAEYVGALGSGTVPALVAALQRLTADESARWAMSAAAAALVDGLGAARVRAHCLPPLLAKDGRRVALRPAASSDAAAMLVWQSAPGARAYARNRAAPEPGEHERWLRAKLADRGCILNVIVHGNEPVGVLRFDRLQGDEGYEVSIVIAADRQGQEIGRRALELGQRLLPRERIVAAVHPENRASVRLFERAGYRREGSDQDGYGVFVLSRAAPRMAAPR